MVGNLQKETTEMSSGGLKMVERSYGMAGSGRKWPKNHEFSGGSRWPPPPPLRRPDLVRPAAVCSEIPPAGSSGCGAPSRPAHVAGGRPVVPRLVQSLTARK